MGATEAKKQQGTLLLRHPIYTQYTLVIIQTLITHILEYTYKSYVMFRNSQNEYADLRYNKVSSTHIQGPSEMKKLLLITQSGQKFCSFLSHASNYCLLLASAAPKTEKNECTPKIWLYPKTTFFLRAAVVYMGGGVLGPLLILCMRMNCSPFRPTGREDFFLNYYSPSLII